MLDVRYFNLSHRTGRRRSIELQGRIHNLAPERIEALRSGEGEAVLPDTQLPPGPKALLAGWYLTLHDVANHGARGDAPWLILLEDDVLLAPWFTRRTLTALESVPDDCLVVQLGFLSKYTWFAPRPLWENVAMAGLYLLRGEWRPSARLRGGGDNPHFSRELLIGGQATAIRVDTIPELIELLEPFRWPNDVLLRQQAREHPGRFLRSRRQLALQAPFFRSDLGKERRQRRANLR